MSWWVEKCLYPGEPSILYSFHTLNVATKVVGTSFEVYMNNSLVVLLFLGNHFTLSLQQFMGLFFRRSSPMLMPNMWTRIYCWVPFVYISLHFRRVQGKFIEKDSVSIPFPNNCACYDDLGRIYNLKTLQNIDETARFAKSYPRHI